MEGDTRRIRSRRSHAKSRLGCGNCKKRRVKCDELKPTCSNCKHHSIDCDFSVASESPSKSSAPYRYRFRQSKFQSFTKPLSTASSSSSPVEADQQTTASVSIQCNLSASPSTPTGGISFADLQLFHHFVTSTYRTLADETTDKNSIWQTHLPQWGISFPSILHLMLALSALHLSHLHPEQKGQYLMQADDHFSFGVRSVTSVLALLDSENCQLIYMSSVLICFVYFGRGPRPGEFLVFNSQGKSEWLVLLHGVRSILASKHDEIFRGVLAINHDERAPTLTPLLREELAQHQMRIREMYSLIDKHVLDDAKREACVSAVDDLLSVFKDAFLNRSKGGHPTDLMSCTMGWTFRLPGRFIGCLEAREPVALVILSYWAILVGYMKSLWFMAGWDKHVLSGIPECLAPEFHEWIEWPNSIINSI